MTEEKLWKLEKRATGIVGLDRLTGGGLPHGQATLLLGEPGAGKTVLALQILSHAVRNGDGGVFISFEESPEQLKRNADSFSWGNVLTREEGWAAIDARVPTHAEHAGSFDIDGLLMMIAARAAAFRRPWIIVDGLDQLLKYQPDRNLAVDQVRQINEWCEQNGWTVLLSGKTGSDQLSPLHLEGVEFMLPVTLILTASMVDRRQQRHLRIAKYRGSAHVPDQVPMIINDNGIQLPYQTVEVDTVVKADSSRVSSGVPELDHILCGGPYRGSSTLISGRPGTAKSTLAASFSEAAAKRGERVLYVSFDELESAFVRNLATIGIQLQPHIDSGRIHFCAWAAWSALTSEHVLKLQQQIDQIDPHFLVIDPISALLKAGRSEGSDVVISRILHAVRSRGITVVMTSLTADGDPEGEATAANVSTIADTWLVLDYNVRAGERNRSLSIVKSRGSAHSNQERELVLSDQGIRLAEAYEYGTEVLMGTARLQRESEVKAELRRQELQRDLRRAELRHQLAQAREQVERLSAELSFDEETERDSASAVLRHAVDVKARRGGKGEEKSGVAGK